MKIQDLIYFCDLVKSHSYSKTALNFDVTQPAITAMVKRLETELNVKLIFQSSKRATLQITTSGMIIFKKAQKILQDIDMMKIEAKRANHHNFVLGYSELAGSIWLASIVQKLNQGKLLANIEMHQENSVILEKHLREGKFDAIIFSRLADTHFRDLHQTILGKYQFKLLVPLSSKLASKKQIDIFQTSELPLLIRHKRFLSHQALKQIFKKTGFKPKKKLLIDNLSAMEQLVKDGLGIGFILDTNLSFPNGVKAVPLIPSQRAYGYASLAVRKDFYPNKIQSEYLDILKTINFSN